MKYLAELYLAIMDNFIYAESRKVIRYLDKYIERLFL